MDREDIIRMALEAGFCEPNPHDGYMGLAYDCRDGADTGASLERFAALVAAVARAEENEECAKACEETTASWTQDLYNSGCMDCAAAIRARG